MIAFVFSGGGSRGAMEAGGVKALYEAGIRPDLLVGSSAGAMNAAFLATDPSPGGVERLCDIWSDLRNRDIVPGSLLRKAWRVLRGKPSVFAQEPLSTDSELYDLDNVILTTHIGIMGGDTMEELMLLFCENLRRYVAGEALLNVVDRAAGY